MLLLHKSVFWRFKENFLDQLDTEVNMFIFLNLNMPQKPDFLFRVLKVKIFTFRLIQSSLTHLTWENWETRPGPTCAVYN